MTTYPNWSDAAILPREDLLALFTADEETGLSASEAMDRLSDIRRHASQEHKATPIEIFFRQFASSFVYLLIAASALAIFLGEYPDALIILAFIIINALLGFYQEYRAEKSLELLKTFVVRMARVRRDGCVARIPFSDIVPGDIILLDAGDMVPADACLLSCDDLSIDESPLTGESIAVDKHAAALRERTERYTEATNILFARTSVLSGNAVALAVAVGNDSAVGAIAHATLEEHRPSTFEVGVGKFSGFILRLVLATIPILFILHLIVGRGEVDVGEFILFIIALTVSAIPEALPLVTTITLTRGALRLAHQDVVPRRLSAIEDLGSIEVLCTDKTGTITENILHVAEMEGDTTLLSLASIAPLSRQDTGSAQNSVYDTAILARADEDHVPVETPRLIAEFPFDPSRRRESVLVDLPGRGRMLIVRGAYEVLLRPDTPDMERADEFACNEGHKGRRTLAVTVLDGLPADVQEITTTMEESARYVGILSFADPLKPSTRAAVCDAERLGVRVKVITGDSLQVAVWAAKEAGIIEGEKDAIKTADLLALSEDEQEKAVLQYDVFARTMPLEKLRIIDLLARQKVVGFLGEGFNDAPALKKAHVGLAVQGASDIAQDASDIILLNASLHVIVDGIKEGRRIFANTTKYIRATLTSNFGNFYALAFSSLFIPYLPMLPMQILLLNLLSDFPMIAVATDEVDERELDRPTSYNIREIVAVAMVLGVVSTIFDFAFFGAFVGEGEKELQTMWFIGSVLTELILLFSIRTRFPLWRTKHPSFFIIGLTSCVSLLTIGLPYTRIGQDLFGFIKPDSTYIVAALGLVALYLLSTEAMKLFFYRWWDTKKGLTERAVSHG